MPIDELPARVITAAVQGDEMEALGLGPELDRALSFRVHDEYICRANFADFQCSKYQSVPHRTSHCPLRCHNLKASCVHVGQPHQASPFLRPMFFFLRKRDNARRDNLPTAFDGMTIAVSVPPVVYDVARSRVGYRFGKKKYMSLNCVDIHLMVPRFVRVAPSIAGHVDDNGDLRRLSSTAAG
ncbi:hypothetical protein BJ508DRAFT_312035 [Ascobolus immersus RN42]|uniref:Uncharacterized protein n=1 Tax=Ascobolus immersus RN42 TaxID=1160509 RepID=A0A3N4HPW9_ASCIM|nr:hypothetical protein BJ508DRAFT_312035 [Ascobolus immersus RN42]